MRNWFDNIVSSTGYNPFSAEAMVAKAASPATEEGLMNINTGIKAVVYNDPDARKELSNANSTLAKGSLTGAAITLPFVGGGAAAMSAPEFFTWSQMQKLPAAERIARTVIPFLGSAITGQATNDASVALTGKSVGENVYDTVSQVLPNYVRNDSDVKAIGTLVGDFLNPGYVLGGYWASKLPGAISNLSARASTKSAPAPKTTATKTKPEYSNWGGEFVDDVAVNSKQQYLPKQSKLTEGELAGLSKHERTNVRTSPKLDPEKAFEVRLGQKMAQEFTDPGVKEVVRNNPSAGMIMKNWMDDGMSEINAFKKYLAERRSVARVVGVPASSVKEGVRKLNRVGEKMAREFKPVNKTMNGDNIPVTEDGILYTAEYFGGGNYGAPEFVIKQSRGLTKHDLHDHIPASDIPKYVVKREYIMRPKMDFSGNTSTWLKNNPPLNAEFRPTTHKFYSKYKSMLDDTAAETSYDYGLRLNKYRNMASPHSEIVFSGKPGELLQMTPVRYRDAYHSLVFPKAEPVHTKSLNGLYSWPEIPVGNSAPWGERAMKIVPYAHKQGGKFYKTCKQ